MLDSDESEFIVIKTSDELYGFDKNHDHYHADDGTEFMLPRQVSWINNRPTFDFIFNNEEHTVNDFDKYVMARCVIGQEPLTDGHAIQGLWAVSAKQQLQQAVAKNPLDWHIILDKEPSHSGDWQQLPNSESLTIASKRGAKKTIVDFLATHTDVLHDLIQLATVE